MAWTSLLDEVKPLLTKYFLMPILLPDLKALGIGALASGVMIGVSAPLAAEEGGLNPRDFIIPAVLFVYMYFHYYSRGPDRAKDDAAAEGSAVPSKAAGIDVDEAIAATTHPCPSGLLRPLARDAKSARAALADDHP